MIPRLGETVDPAQSYTLRPGAYVILPRGRDILLTVQFAEEPDIQFPGGGIDPGEPTLPALYREVLEETGWSISRPKLFTTYRRFVFMPDYDMWAEKLSRIFVAAPARRICDPLEDHHAPLWLPMQEALNEIGNPPDRKILRHYLNARR